MTAQITLALPEDSTRSALGRSAGSDLSRMYDAQSRRRSCLMCQGSGGWQVARLFMGHWMAAWKECPHCKPTASRQEPLAGKEPQS